GAQALHGDEDQCAGDRHEGDDHREATPAPSPRGTGGEVDRGQVLVGLVGGGRRWRRGWGQSHRRSSGGTWRLRRRPLTRIQAAYSAVPPSTSTYETAT